MNRKCIVALRCSPDSVAPLFPLNRLYCFELQVVVQAKCAARAWHLGQLWCSIQ